MCGKNTLNHIEMLHVFMLQLHISLGLLFSFMLQQNCDYGLGRLGKDHVLSYICFCCHKHDWKRSRCLIKNIQWFVIQMLKCHL